MRTWTLPPHLSPGSHQVLHGLGQLVNHFRQNDRHALCQGLECESTGVERQRIKLLSE